MSQQFVSDYSFSPKEWEALPYNVMLPLHGKYDSFLDRFDALKSIDAFRAKLKPGLDKDIIIKYIVIYYSPTSPVQKRIENIIERKKVAALEAGFEVDPDTFRVHEEYEDVLYCKDHEVNNMIIGYLRKLKNPEWALLVVGYDSFFIKLAESINPRNFSDKKTSVELEKIKGDLYEQCESMIKNLRALSLDFLADGSPYLSQDLFVFLESENSQLMLSPELRLAVKANGFI